MENEKEIFERSAQKQVKLSKKIFLLVFGLLGAVFAVVGAALLIAGVEGEDGFNPGVIFAPMGVFYILLGVILYLCIPKTLSYERYKKRLQTYGTPDYYQMAAMLNVQEEKLKALEDRVANLEDDKEELESRLRARHMI